MFYRLRQITGISKELEADGYGSIRGKVSRKLVAYVLDSDFYLGIRRIKAQFSESGKEEIIENDHEPLISREMFDAVPKRRDSEIELIIANIKTSYLIQSLKTKKSLKVPVIWAFGDFLLLN